MFDVYIDILLIFKCGNAIVEVLGIYKGLEMEFEGLQVGEKW